MVLLDLFFDEAHAPPEVGRRGARVGLFLRSTLGERQSLGHLHERLVLHGARGGDHHARGDVALGVEVAQLLARDRADRLGRADHRAPERM